MDLDYRSWPFTMHQVSEQPSCIAQLPSAATNPLGPYLPKEVTEGRPNLHTEFQRLRLEAAVDAALAEARADNAKKQ